MYFGSVRFFKNLILLAVVIMIAVPTGVSIHYKQQLSQQQEQLAGLQDTVAGMEEQAAQTMLQLNELQQQQQIGGVQAGQLDYQKLYPDFYAPQELDASQKLHKTMYLTFDDGPSVRTDEILQILARHEVKATFFVVGKTDELSLQRMRNIVEQGHTLAMHSYSHDYKKIYASVEAYLDDMYRIFTLIRDTTGQTPTVFRMPGGSINGYNNGIYQELLAEMLRRGFLPCDWNLSSADAASPMPAAQQILLNVVGNAANKERGFVLMHDSASHTTTVEALEPMIVGLKELGFRFDRITPQTSPVLFSYRN